MKEERNICDVIEGRLKRDLKGSDVALGFSVGDVIIKVRDTSSMFMTRRNDFKIAVESSGVHGSYLKAIKVLPENIDAYMDSCYPALLEKVKKTIANIQVIANNRKLAKIKAREQQQDLDIKRITFIKQAGLGELLDLNNNTMFWKTKDGALRLRLIGEAFTIDSCSAHLSPAQVKAIINILKEA